MSSDDGSLAPWLHGSLALWRINPSVDNFDISISRDPKTKMLGFWGFRHNVSVRIIMIIIISFSSSRNSCSSSSSSTRTYF